MAANTEHAMFVEHCQERMSKASKRFDVALRGTNLKPYIDAIEQHGCIDLPPRYVVVKVAELIKVTREQEIFETYTRLLIQHNTAMVADFQAVKDEMLSELQVKQRQRDECKHLIQERLVQIVTEKVRSYYADKKTQDQCLTQPSILEKLVTRKASNRLCYVNE
jgi:hypothetical protein